LGAGDRFEEAMKRPEALKTLTGEERMDAGVMMEYFAPLKNGLTSRMPPPERSQAGNRGCFCEGSFVFGLPFSPPSG
jgi:hypothetical protein